MLEIALLVVLLVAPAGLKAKRFIAIYLIGLLILANLVSLGLVIRALLDGNHSASGHPLLVSAVAIYLTNIIVFGILYWELDNTRTAVDDFQFPQASSAKPADKNWRPSFFDYLYVSLTNATAFSPTDTLPLTHRAKLLMSLQSLVALVTVALVAARAVKILA